MGVTGVVDFEFSGDHHDWAERFHEGANLLRVRTATYADGLDAVIAAGLRTGDLLPDCDERITMGPLKIISDGSLNTRTAWCCEPYADGSGSRRSRTRPTRSCTTCSSSRAGNGLEVATHAIGDAAVRSALLAYEATGAVGLDRARPADPARGRPPTGRARRPRQRPTRPPARRPRRDRAGLGRPGQPVLRTALDARRRRHPRVRLGRARLPARPVAGHGGRGPPQRGRAGAVAPRAGAHRAGGAGRVRRRPGHRPRRLARRPGAPRRATRSTRPTTSLEQADRLRDMHVTPPGWPASWSTPSPDTGAHWPVMAEIRVGVSGWKYPRWRGDFYPQGLVQRRELEYVAVADELGRAQRLVLLPAAAVDVPAPSSTQTPDDFPSRSRAAASSPT